MAAGGLVSVRIEENHPLLLLAGCMPWESMAELVVQDLKATTIQGFWFMGRKIQVRTHLAAYLLQKLYDLTDRKTEYQLKDNAACQLFCGATVVKNWRAPDHTKIEEFRNRLSPETQRALANALAQHATEIGFADPHVVDIDSTVQEANIAYPSDAGLMHKLVKMSAKVIGYIKENRPHSKLAKIKLDLENIGKKARGYFFLSKNTSLQKRREAFKSLHSLIKAQMKPVVEAATSIRTGQIPWNIQKSLDTIKSDAWRYLLDVAHFIRTHSIKPSKLLSWHAKAVACIRKGKPGKENEFGRVYQLGRLAGNFVFVAKATSIRMNDKTSFQPMLEEHQRLFGTGTLLSLTADKGYWRFDNLRCAIEASIEECGLQRPANVKAQLGRLTPSRERELRDRRAGIEPVIGHLKQGGQLGRSRMKSDTATLAAGYGSVLGFNLRQLIRCQQGKMKRAA